MTCDVIRDLMPLCADGVASEESRAAVEAHIRTCEACRALYESMCAPVEAQEPAKEPDYMAAVRQQIPNHFTSHMSPSISCKILLFTRKYVTLAQLSVFPKASAISRKAMPSSRMRKT